MAQRLVRHGFQADRALLVDAIERAYNASVCRSESHIRSGRPEALGSRKGGTKRYKATVSGRVKRQLAGDSDGVI